MVLRTDFRMVGGKIDSLLSGVKKNFVLERVAKGWKKIEPVGGSVSAADASRAVRKFENFYLFGVRAVGMSPRRRVVAEYMDVLPLPERGEEYARFIMEAVEAKVLSVLGPESDVLLFDGPMSAAPSLVPVFPSGRFVWLYASHREVINNYLLFYVASLMDDYVELRRRLLGDGFTFRNVVRSLSTEYHPGDYVGDAPNYGEVERLHEEVVSLINGGRAGRLARDVLALLIYVEYVWSVEQLFRHYYKVVGFAKSGYRRYVLGEDAGMLTDNLVVRSTVLERGLPLPGYLEVWHWVDKTAVPGYLKDVFNVLGFSVFLSVDEQDERVFPHRLYYLHSRGAPVYYVESFAEPDRVVPIVENVVDNSGYPIVLKMVHKDSVISFDEFETSLMILKNYTSNPLMAFVFGRSPLL